MKRITPCLWFDSNAEEAAKFYTSVFNAAPGKGGSSKITNISHYGESGSKASGRPKGSVMTVLFELHGQEYMALNGGPMFKFSEAISLMIMCENQQEIDYYWNALGSAGGGEDSVCGWLKDKFGLSWQIAPTAMNEMMEKGTPQQQERMMSALMGMKKLDVAALQKAYEGK
jgi:predicted 3-demethylubiquinone-9 3-methyltransferase (glyoxalase superfamily)